jgi:ribosomal protein S18 acetylase RimI-like enzyme
MRQATNDDYNFLYQLHAATMREYTEATWGWQEAWQQEYFEERFDPTNRQIIQIDEQDAGVVIVEQRDQEFYLALIEILPIFQGRGVGTAIIRRIIVEAHSASLPVTLQVLTPAKDLYSRLGFTTVQEEEIRYKMACSVQVKSETDRGIQNHYRTLSHQDGGAYPSNNP